jgi:hypothetical protein|tara:strand:- start:238 stop:441 length:204 start_codon:yes stop_codon:yes gene_type:complete
VVGGKIWPENHADFPVSSCRDRVFAQRLQYGKISTGFLLDEILFLRLFDFFHRERRKQLSRYLDAGE